MKNNNLWEQYDLYKQKQIYSSILKIYYNLKTTRMKDMGLYIAVALIYYSQLFNYNDKYIIVNKNDNDKTYHIKINEITYDIYSDNQINLISSPGLAIQCPEKDEKMIKQTINNIIVKLIRDNKLNELISEN